MPGRTRTMPRLIPGAGGPSAWVTFRTRAGSCGLTRALAHVPTSMSTAAASSHAPRGGAPSALPLPATHARTIV
eukprot:6604578-Prymnesium_polylepis.1